MREKPLVPLVSMPPIFLRRRDAARVLAVSESVILQFERKGWLTPVRLPGLRAVRYSRDEVEAFAARVVRGEV